MIFTVGTKDQIKVFIPFPCLLIISDFSRNSDLEISKFFFKYKITETGAALFRSTFSK